MDNWIRTENARMLDWKVSGIQAFLYLKPPANDSSRGFHFYSIFSAASFITQKPPGTKPSEKYAKR